MPIPQTHKISRPIYLLPLHWRLIRQENSVPLFSVKFLRHREFIALLSKSDHYLSLIGFCDRDNQFTAEQALNLK